VLVVNKADRPEADRARAELLLLQSLAPTAAWQPPVLDTVAVRGQGVPELVEALEAHRAYLERSGEGQQRARDRARSAVLAAARAQLSARLEQAAAAERWEACWEAVAARQRTPDDVAAELLGVVMSEE
jgi:LAO/AO transport system kinase